MRLILSDYIKLPVSVVKDSVVITDNGKMRNCIGCFGCWIKTPAKCIIKDGYENLGKQFSNCSELLIISKCVYGSVSPLIKNIFDRSISYIHPYFEIVNGEMHHKRRYDNTFKITVYFYGENISDREKETAQKLLKAMAVNFHSSINKIIFLNNINELESTL